jgi:hypothetical protein
MAQPTRDDVWLCLHLYEQRREPVLRAAREWMIEFQPRSFRDVAKVIDGSAGLEANRYWRQVTSYWDMISAIMVSGAVTPECRELFAKTTREFFLLYAKLHPYLDQIRAMTRPTAFTSLEAFCRSLPDYEATLAMFTRVVGQIRERIARSKKGGAKERPRRRST